MPHSSNPVDDIRAASSYREHAQRELWLEDVWYFRRERSSETRERFASECSVCLMDF
ncbi:hypothetical protein BD410DRAFT_789462 [Rickenella mellea]|uniref:Uncharacterized protein n=1 Tax=Rickenella mellea TaxID=50990 RepID=A0A4Y7Q4G8_9AGAM|nr:hypothetical protein BD410DRAFT_789462 [Rickenella mellea]